MMSLTSICLLNKFDWSKYFLLGASHIDLDLDLMNKFFRRMNLEAASSNGTVQSSFLTLYSCSHVVPIAINLYKPSRQLHVQS